MANDSTSACPVVGAVGTDNTHWWPERLNLKILAKNPAVANPLGADFDYKAAFLALDLEDVKKSIAAVLTDSLDWWPADFGNYGPLIVRMAWHAAGTYRSHDGRGGAGGGQQRFAPLDSWPDNVSLDKARRLLWPVKKKYGKALSWGDLMILAGNVAMETMGLKIFGFGGGRVETWEPDDDVYWGSETSWLATDQRYPISGVRELDTPLAATTMGLIYVNPEGPEGKPDPLAAAADIRETFARMSMDDEETVALIAGGHTFGKAHGAAPEGDHVGPDPEGAPMEQQGLGWKNSFGSGVGDDTITSGIEVTWTYHPTRWDNEFFHILYAYEWELVKGPGGHYHWRPKDGAGADMVPLAHSEGRREPRMLTTDLSLRMDPAYDAISRRFRDDQAAFADAFARAWFKLTHRDMGPKARYLGADVPKEDLIWQDPLPAPKGTLSKADIAALKKAIRDSECSASDLVRTAWASASTFRSSDKRGGANGARVRLEPQRSWAVNTAGPVASTIAALEAIQADSGTAVSLADLIVLAGGVGIEMAASAAGTPVSVPFTPGRTDATQAQTDVTSFAFLEPVADGFRNYVGPQARLDAEYLLVDKANLLGLSAPEMTVLLGGLRVIGTNWDGSDLGVFTDRPGQLTNDFFVNLLDLGTTWTPLDPGSHAFRGTGPKGQSWTGTRADLVFGSNSELRAIAEVYACDDARGKFLDDFVAAWVKVMEADRFDLR